MYTHYSFWKSQAFPVLLSLVIVSCQKETAPKLADPASSANSKTTTSLVVQGPPPIDWWANGPTIPYTDDIPGDVPSYNQFAQGFAINGKGFVCGTLLTTSYETGEDITDLWQYDPATLAWTKKTSFPGAPSSLIESTSFVIGDNAYIVTGNTTWQYNQPTDTWKQKAYVFSVQRMLATSFAINGKGYMGLGYDPNSSNLTEQNDWWQYDPVADKWTQQTGFPGGKRSGAAGFAVDGKGYVVSGSHYANGHGNWGNKVWQYDPVTDSWIQKADFPGAGRYRAVAANATIGGNDFGLIAGGDNGQVGFSDAWEYNPRLDTWGQFANMLGGPRTEAAAFVVGRSFFIANKTVVILNWSN